MIKEELKKLFNADVQPFEKNDITTSVLSDFDNLILDLIDEEKFSSEILDVYKKFVVMKQEAPDSMKVNLFTTIRNFAKDLISNKIFIEAFVLYRFLIVKSELIPDDYSTIAENLVKINAPKLAKNFMTIYATKEQNKVLMFLTLANFYNLQIGDYRKAIKYYEKYVEIDKTKAVIYSILGNLYSKVYGDSSISEQIFYFEKAYKLNPTSRLVLHALAFAYEKIRNQDKADKFYKEILNNNPTEIDYYNYGSFLISCGNFVQGHKYFRYRFLIDDENLKYPIDNSFSKKWDLVSDISDKTLLVHYEQGFGDTFMYCRFIPLLKKFARKIIFVVQDSLFDLIKNSPIISDGIEVLSDKTSVRNIYYDYDMALLDAPFVLKTTTTSIPYPQGYLTVNAPEVKTYASKYLKNKSNLKIGIAYSGDKNANYSGRDIDLKKFNIITNLENVNVYSLQVGSEIENPKIIDLGNTFNDFTDTACAIKNMDIVISTDNVILNLAGALGVKTLGLFNKQTNFRWFKTTGENVGWYNSVKPLQACVQDDWTTVFPQVVNILSEYHS